MKFLYIGIGLAIGIILSLQIRAQPVAVGSFPAEQIELQKVIFDTFSSEQVSLKERLDIITSKSQEAHKLMEQRSSAKVLKRFDSLKSLTGFKEILGTGIRITLSDNLSTIKTDLAAVNENFVQASDLRDLINALFLQDAIAVRVNGKRIMPLTTIQSVFDNVLIDNVQMHAPFTVEAIGNTESLFAALQYINKRKLQIFVDQDVSLKIPAQDVIKGFKFASLYQS